VGMQLLCEHSEENNTDCLGIVPVEVKKFVTGTEAIKIPQVGWNTIYDLKSDLFRQVPENSYIYNVHSYYADNSEYTIARCHYGVEYAAAVKKDNFYGVQFHTEKSAENGDKIIKNFLEL
jgi:glutamine amidotransferase